MPKISKTAYREYRSKQRVQAQLVEIEERPIGDEVAFAGASGRNGDYLVRYPDGTVKFISPEVFEAAWEPSVATPVELEEE